MLEYLTRVANVELADVRMVAEKVATTDQEKVTTTLAERMEREALKRGKAQVILRLLKHRFGPLPDDLVLRIESGSGPDFDRWSDRLLVAERLEQVFDETPLPER